MAGRVEPEGPKRLKRAAGDWAYMPPAERRKLQAQSDDLLEHLTQFGRRSLEAERKLPLLTRIKITIKRKLGMRL